MDGSMDGVVDGGVLEFATYITCELDTLNVCVVVCTYMYQCKFCCQSPGPNPQDTYICTSEVKKS